MKNLVLLSFALIAINSFSQVSAVVSAPVTEEILLKQSLTSKSNFVKQMAELKKQTDNVIEIKEKLMTVSSRIKEGRKAVNVAKKSTQIFDLLGTSVKDLKNSKYSPKIKNKPLKILEEILGDAEAISDDVTNVLTSGVFRMTDAERMTFLDDLDKKLDDIRFNINSTMRSTHRYGRMYSAYSKR